MRSVNVPARNLTALSSLPPRVFYLSPVVTAGNVLDSVNIDTSASKLVYAVISAVSAAPLWLGRLRVPAHPAGSCSCRRPSPV